MAKAQGLTGQVAKGLGGYRGLLTPRGGARGWVPSRATLPGLSIELLLFSRPRPRPRCSYLEPAMEWDQGPQRVNSFNHCCYARV